MLFSSITFIYLFLPILMIIYFLSENRFHNIILLLASLLFYTLGEPKYVLVMLSVITINYLGAIIIDKIENNLHKKISLLLVIMLNLNILIYFKYYNFIFDTINNIFHINLPLLHIIMPIGISFYIFQAISYVIDVYRGTVKAETNFSKIALYISLFPQLIAGPIIKYHDIESQIRERFLDFDKIILGTKRFIIGLSKKVIIANTLGAIVDKIFIQAPDAFSPSIAWLGALCYSLQLFFDFSGYSDMAIGLGMIFGFKIPENFNYPYISKSITEFWRRWHISLSSWFKNYVYIPLGGNKTGIIKTIRNLSIVFILTGIWHGAAMHFVVWGIWNGFFIIIEKLLGIGKKNETSSKSILYSILMRLYTIFVLIIGWVIFRSENISYAIKYIKNMFNMVNIHNEIYPLAYYAERYETIILIIAILCSTPIFSKILKNAETSILKKTIVNLGLILLFIYSTIILVTASYNPFIYFIF